MIVDSGSQPCLRELAVDLVQNGAGCVAGNICSAKNFCVSQRVIEICLVLDSRRVIGDAANTGGIQFRRAVSTISCEAASSA